MTLTTATYATSHTILAAHAYLCPVVTQFKLTTGQFYSNARIHQNNKRQQGWARKPWAHTAADAATATAAPHPPAAAGPSTAAPVASTSAAPAGHVHASPTAAPTAAGAPAASAAPPTQPVATVPGAPVVAPPPPRPKCLAECYTHLQTGGGALRTGSKQVMGSYLERLAEVQDKMWEEVLQNKYQRSRADRFMGNASALDGFWAKVLREASHVLDRIRKLGLPNVTTYKLVVCYGAAYTFISNSRGKLQAPRVTAFESLRAAAAGHQSRRPQDGLEVMVVDEAYSSVRCAFTLADLHRVFVRHKNEGGREGRPSGLGPAPGSHPPSPSGRVRKLVHVGLRHGPPAVLASDRLVHLEMERKRVAKDKRRRCGGWPQHNDEAVDAALLIREAGAQHSVYTWPPRKHHVAKLIEEGDPVTATRYENTGDRSWLWVPLLAAALGHELMYPRLAVARAPVCDWVAAIEQALQVGQKASWQDWVGGGNCLVPNAARQLAGLVGATAPDVVAAVEQQADKLAEAAATCFTKELRRLRCRECRGLHFHGLYKQLFGRDTAAAHNIAELGLIMLVTRSRPVSFMRIRAAATVNATNRPNS